MSKLVLFALLLVTGCASTANSLSPKQSYALGVRMAVNEDFEKANRFLKSSAENNFLPGQWDYAIFLNGMAPDSFLNPVEAYAWFTVVLEREPIQYKRAENYLKNIESKLSRKELSEAKSLSELYLSRYLSDSKE